MRSTCHYLKLQILLRGSPGGVLAKSVVIVTLKHTYTKKENNDDTRKKTVMAQPEATSQEQSRMKYQSANWELHH